MSRFHGSADRAVSTRRKIVTPGPMMGNVTVEVYQEPRDLHRLRTGGKYFPGSVDDMTMYMSEFELVFMFKDGSTRASIDHGNPYGSHIGYPVFSVLNGIEGDKFWLYENVDLVGVTKSHTRLNDRGTGKFSQTAAFRAGSASIIHNGMETITANTEFKVVFYDKVNDPEKFHELFETRRKLEGGRVRILGVIEPYHKHDDIAMMMRYYHPHQNVGTAGRPDGHRRSGPGALVGGQYTVESIMEQVIKGSSGTLLLGYLIGKFIDDNPTRLTREAANLKNEFKTYVQNNYNRTRLQSILDAFYCQGSAVSSGLGEFVANLLFPNTGADLLVGRTDPTPNKRSGLAFALAAQKDSAYLYPAMKELHTWERKWVVGLAQHTTHPNGVMDIIIRR